MALSDLKWDPVKLDIILDEFGEPEMIYSDDCTKQSLGISIRENPIARQLVNCEEGEAELLAERLAESLANENPEIEIGSLRYQLVQNKLHFTVELNTPEGISITAYYKDIFRGN